MPASLKQIKDFLIHKDISFTPFEDCIEVTNKATNEAIAYVRKTSQEELEEIIQKAKIAQNLWAKQTALSRADILLKYYNLILENKDLLATIMTMEQGKSFTESSGEIVYSASFIRWFAEEARRVDGDVLQSVKPTQRMIVLKQPIGVCAAITPWNFPAAMITRKVGPALSVGCAMIVKPASLTPLSAYAQEILAIKAGIPKDLLVVVNGSASKISNTFATNPTIRKITFTGSTEVGSKIFEQSAKDIKKLSLELGGNAPFIVFEDANLDKAVDGILASKFRNSGQTCVCANRVYVHSSIYEELTSRLLVKVKALKLGNGLDEGVNQGPLIEPKAVDKVLEHIKDATSKGAKVVTGGKVSSLGGQFFEPTILTSVTQDMQVANDETFGPLCPLFKFDTEEEVIQKANATIFGLASYIFTDSVSRQWRMAESLEYGMVGVNSGLISNEVAPFGGVKASGLGREGSKYGVEDYLEIKYVCVDIE